MKDSGSREPLTFLLFSTSLLSKPTRKPRCTSNAAGFSYLCEWTIILDIDIESCVVSFSIFTDRCSIPLSGY